MKHISGRCPIRHILDFNECHSASMLIKGLVP